MTWKTYLVMYFNSDSESKMTDIVEKVESLGFTSALGPVDFHYNWDKEPTKEEIFALGDKLKDTLKGSGVIFNLDTNN